jgi:hypothetical protein
VLQVAARDMQSYEQFTRRVLHARSRCAVSRLWWSWDSTSAAAPCCPGERRSRRSLAGIAGAPSGKRTGAVRPAPLCQPGSRAPAPLPSWGARPGRDCRPPPRLPEYPLVTTDPAPMTLLSPMVTPGQMTTLPQSRRCCRCAPACRTPPPDARRHRHRVGSGVDLHPGASSTLSPMCTSHTSRMVQLIGVEIRRQDVGTIVAKRA